MSLAKIFTSGNSQAVRLPKEFRFSSTVVNIEKIGNSIVLSPPTNSWDALVDACGTFPTDIFNTLPDDLPVQERPPIV